MFHLPCRSFQSFRAQKYIFFLNYVTKRQKNLQITYNLLFCDIFLLLNTINIRVERLFRCINTFREEL
jgi:hypothetical protein